MISCFFKKNQLPGGVPGGGRRRLHPLLVRRRGAAEPALRDGVREKKEDFTFKVCRKLYFFSRLSKAPPIRNELKPGIVYLDIQYLTSATYFKSSR